MITGIVLFVILIVLILLFFFIFVLNQIMNTSKKKLNMPAVKAKKSSVI